MISPGLDQFGRAEDRVSSEGSRPVVIHRMVLPFSNTSSPLIVIIRAPVSAITPDGLSAAWVKRVATCFTNRGRSPDRQPEKGTRFNSRLNSSGPSDQYT